METIILLLIYTRYIQSYHHNTQDLLNECIYAFHVRRTKWIKKNRKEIEAKIILWRDKKCIKIKMAHTHKAKLTIWFHFCFSFSVLYCYSLLILSCNRFNSTLHLYVSERIIKINFYKFNFLYFMQKEKERRRKRMDESIHQFTSLAFIKYNRDGTVWKPVMLASLSQLPGVRLCKFPENLVKPTFSEQWSGPK